MRDVEIPQPAMLVGWMMSQIGRNLYRPYTVAYESPAPPHRDPHHQQVDPRRRAIPVAVGGNAAQTATKVQVGVFAVRQLAQPAPTGGGTSAKMSNAGSRAARIAANTRCALVGDDPRPGPRLPVRTVPTPRRRRPVVPPTVSPVPATLQLQCE